MKTKRESKNWKMIMAQHRRFPILIIGLVLIVVFAVGFLGVFLSIRSAVRAQFGPPTPSLTLIQRILYPLELFLNRGDLVSAPSFNGEEQAFVIEPGKSVSMVCLRLENTGLIHDAELLRTYLVYTGLDRHLQSGRFQLSLAMSPVQIAAEMLDATPEEAVVSILPGWRIEEVAANVAGSGLAVSSEEFIHAAYDPSSEAQSLIPLTQC